MSDEAAPQDLSTASLFEVRIANLRGIGQGVVDDLAPLTVLIGPNGSGKSTVLDALLIGAHNSTEVAIGHAVQRRAGLDDAARWLLRKADPDAAAEIRVRGAEGDRTTILRRDARANSVSLLQGDGHAGPYTQLSAKIWPTLDPGDASPSAEATVVFAYDGEFDTMHAKGPSTIAPYVRLIDSGQAFRSGPVTQLYTRLMQQGRLDIARDLVRALVHDADDLRIGVDEAEKPVLHVHWSGGRGSTPLALVGDGTKLAVRAGLDLAMIPGGVALLEEPEVHLHPRAIWLVAAAIAAAVRRGIQVILTTHSMELLDALIAETADDLRRLAVFRTRLDDGKLLVSRIAGESAREARVDLAEDLR